MASIEVFSDVACPWCFIGKRRLEAALAGLPTPKRPPIRWRAFQLQPDAPTRALDAAASRTFFESKFGGAARVRAIFDHVSAIGREVGIQFQLDRQHIVNTRLAHRLVAIAGAWARDNPAVDALFRAHFEEGRDIGDVDVAIAVVAEATGLASNVLHDALRNGDGDDEVTADLQRARQLGIEGVPLFIRDGSVAVSGAQPVDVFRKFLEDGAAA